MTTHHFFSPHRDDALLTFGGHILNLVSQKQPVFVHTIFGQDGYLRPQFLEEIENKRIKHPHINNLISILGLNKSEYEHKINNLLDKSGRNLLELGILIRHLEENSVAKKASYTLQEYNLPCAFPQRGYKKFNEPLRNDDCLAQIKILTEELPDLYQLLNSKKISSGDDVKLYFPAGIGGHPDHLILAKLGMEISSRYPNRVLFGQDLPYSSVQEWFGKSPLPFENMDKIIVNIKRSVNSKISLLFLYQSQLSNEDLRLAEIYPKHIADLISRDYELKGDFPSLVENNFPIEIQYQFPHA